jgi:hypothetical protein
MSNYVKSTNFTTKDTLTPGDPNKIVKGTEIDTEFIAIASAIQSKSDLASPAFTGIPTAPTAEFLTNTAQLATTAFVQAAIQAAYPIGSIYTNAVSSLNPATLLGFGTWTAFGAGRVMVGFDSSNPLFDTAEETGGSANTPVVSHTHTATVSDPGHNHTVYAAQNTGIIGSFGGGIASSAVTITSSTSTTGVSVSNASTGVSGTNTNYQPYITVYMWKRTS